MQQNLRPGGVGLRFWGLETFILVCLHICFDWSVIIMIHSVLLKPKMAADQSVFILFLLFWYFSHWFCLISHLFKVILCLLWDPFTLKPECCYVQFLLVSVIISESVAEFRLWLTSLITEASWELRAELCSNIEGCVKKPSPRVKPPYIDFSHQQLKLDPHQQQRHQITACVSNVEVRTRGHCHL